MKPYIDSSDDCHAASQKSNYILHKKLNVNSWTRNHAQVSSITDKFHPGKAVLAANPAADSFPHKSS